MPEAPGAKVVVRRDRKLADVGRRWLLVVFELGKHLLQREAQRLQLFLLQPDGCRLSVLADDAQAERALPGLPERLHVDAARHIELFRHSCGRRSYTQ